MNKVRSSLVATATAFAVATAGVSVATAQSSSPEATATTTATSTPVAENPQDTDSTEAGSAEGSSDLFTGDNALDNIKTAITIVTAVIGALTAIYTFYERVTK